MSRTPLHKRADAVVVGDRIACGDVVETMTRAGIVTLVYQKPDGRRSSSTHKPAHPIATFPLEQR